MNGHPKEADAADSCSPPGCLYANEMVDKLYTRFGITADAQSHIVPTLLRQQQ